jgi:DNA-directed RNA polymerase specialized sigma24 family protein
VNTCDGRPFELDGQALIDCLEKRPSGQMLPDALKPELLRHARWKVRELSTNGLDEDVVQQTWLRLVERGTEKVDPSGNALGLAKCVLRSYAIRDVLASYAAPGAKKRPSAAERETANGPVSLDAPINVEGDTLKDMIEITGQRCDRSVPQVSKRFTSAGDDGMCERAYAKGLLAEANRSAPAFVAEALLLVYVEGRTIPEAARLVDTTPARLRRAIDRWVEEAGLNLDSETAGSEQKSVTAHADSDVGNTRELVFPSNERHLLVRVA